ncbi:uncharacterized protein K460DRAFT_61313 [Cucurbitaria berberidis CBS 394.84]|uniref:Uncharacterized protein n=1 Tax=Cucurbitaria berberidis CBS 394.84 TaxID=1168544 RepID=A0A9P4LAW1_9PLEO|nr:uncharacterized protein K460DRAFT_61313 [Cucurbitaria berberidis CBS 394.84]KAF1847594.1 hypothetical protein K460DRAFT_61313 [Cucurbitaria berberidis CBS 394.84]
MQCLAQAGGMSPTNPKGEIQLTLWKIHDFCNTAHPNLYDLLVRLLAFMKAASQPKTFSVIPPRLSAVTTFANRFMPTPGMNSPSTVPVGFTRPGGGSGSGEGAALSWWESTLSPGMPVPTEYLAQLPPNWPYTAYGVARQSGMVTSWALVQPNASSSLQSTVAWVYHSVLWNPRPLFTPSDAIAAASGKLYNPLLEGWTHAFQDAQTAAVRAATTPAPLTQSPALLLTSGETGPRIESSSLSTIVDGGQTSLLARGMRAAVTTTIVEPKMTSASVPVTTVRESVPSAVWEELQSIQSRFGR